MNVIFIGGYTFVGPLDPYTALLWSAGGNRRLLSSWTGALYRVRRASDDAEMDVGPLLDGSEDQASVISWAGGANVYLVTIYDQTGAGNHFSPTATSRQPLVCDTSGVFHDFEGDGTDDDLLAVNDSADTSVKTIFWDGTDRNYTSKIFLEYGDASTIGGSGKAWQFQSVSASDTNAYRGNNNASYAHKEFTSLGASGVRALFLNGAPPPQSGENMFFLRSAGAAATYAPTYSAGDPSLTSGAQKWRFFRQTGANVAEFTLRTFAIYDGDRAADIPAICTALA